jgi:SAM-dependent methyltransferase/uncharacterized Fe-S cluster-containing radical SAM superfamily protein
MLNFEVRHRKALLNIGYHCNNNCLFCHNSNSKSTDINLDTSECMRRIEDVARKNVDMVVFAGGEPTIRKDIVNLCEYAKELGLACGLITNGRMLCYKDFVGKLVASGVEYIVVSIHGDNSDIHDLHVRAKGFKQTIKGLINISDMPIQLVVKTILTRHNVDRLRIMRHILKCFPTLHYTISLPAPDFDFALPLKDATIAINDFLRSFDTEVENISIGIEGLTPCLLEDYFKVKDDFFTHGFCLVREPEDFDCTMPFYRDLSFLQSCLSCSLYRLCPGIHMKHFEKYPKLKLIPFQQPITNIVNFELHSELQLCDKNANLCYLSALQKPDPARWILAKIGRKFLLFNTNENQTNVMELIRIKFNFEMVYFCDDVENSQITKKKLAKMQLKKECKKCERKTQCPGLFIRTRKKVNDKHENIRKITNLLHGRICEVGCGDGSAIEYNPGYPLSKKEWENMYKSDQLKDAIYSHFDLFIKMIDNNRITLYVGVDPCLPEREKYDRRKTFQLFSMRFEDFKWKEPPFDFVIMYRSYDHLEDLDKSLQVLVSLLKPQGQVIITENNPMVYLNMQQLGSFGTPEHYRNHTAEEAMRKLEEFGLKKVNQWHSHQTPGEFWTLVAKKI